MYTYRQFPPKPKLLVTTGGTLDPPDQGTLSLSRRQQQSTGKPRVKTGQASDHSDTTNSEAQPLYMLSSIPCSL
jgi:hypothetical protein